MPRKPDESGIPIDPFPSTQEPYVHIIAPNIDRISRASFARGSVERGRAIRGAIVLGIVIAVVAMVAVVGVLIGSLH
jgi:hypothetical protein